MIVVAFHIFEAHSVSHMEQIINHGYLAVDFFFLLSGFVIGYAYDDRWGKLSIGGFFRRRLIRLQPMVIWDDYWCGALCFYFGDSAMWPNIHSVPVGKVLLIMLIGFALIPIPISMDIRGWEKLHPLVLVFISSVATQFLHFAIFANIWQVNKLILWETNLATK